MSTLARASLLAVAGAVVGFAANGLRADGLPLREPILAEAAAEQSACVVPAEGAEVALDEALALRLRPGVVFVDARDAAAFAQGHVAEAYHLPCKSQAPAHLPAVASAQTVVVYGSGADDARWVAEALRKAGARDVRLLREGFEAWRARGGAAEAGDCERCGGS